MKQIEKRITSMEVAEMMDKEHRNLLRDIKKYSEQLTQVEIDLSDFFIENTYQDSSNRNRLCYLVTKKGCDFIANKIKGVKGTAFTARYINCFYEMEHHLEDNTEYCKNKEPIPLAKKSWYSVNKTKIDFICEFWQRDKKYLYHKILLELEQIFNLDYLNMIYNKELGHFPNYSMELVDYFKDLNFVATEYLNFLYEVCHYKWAQDREIKSRAQK